jgi:hypothetical protein
MSPTIPSSDVSVQTAYRASIISFVFLILMFISFSQLETFPDIIYLSTLFAIGFHIALLPMIAVMPAIIWTKIGGYIWVTMDIILAVAGLNGVPDSTIQAFRFGVHVVLVIWPIGIAFSNTGLLRWTCWAFAITTGVFPLMGPLAPPTAHFAGLPFIIAWYIAMILKFKEMKEKTTMATTSRT